MQALLQQASGGKKKWGCLLLENLSSLREMGLEMIQAHPPFHPDLRL